MALYRLLKHSENKQEHQKMFRRVNTEFMNAAADHDQISISQGEALYTSESILSDNHKMVHIVRPTRQEKTRQTIQKRDRKQDKQGTKQYKNIRQRLSFPFLTSGKCPTLHPSRCCFPP